MENSNWKGDKIALENIRNNTLCLLTKEGVKNFSTSEIGYIVHVSNIPQRDEEERYILEGEYVRYKIILSVDAYRLGVSLEKIFQENMTSISDIQFFATWQTCLGMTGENMKQLLMGLFLPPILAENMSIEHQLKYSYRTKHFVNSWNNFLEYKYCSEHGISVFECRKLFEKKEG